MRATSTKISSPGSLQGYAHVFNARHMLSQHRFGSYELGFGPLSPVLYLYGSLWSWRICFGDCWLSFSFTKLTKTQKYFSFVGSGLNLYYFCRWIWLFSLNTRAVRQPEGYLSLNFCIWRTTPNGRGGSSV